MRRSTSIWLGLAVAALLAGCAGFGGVATPSDAERSAYERALGRAQREPASARQVLTEFVTRWPDGALEPEARLRLGDLALAEGDTEAALVHWYRILRTSPRNPVADAARVRIAGIEWDLANFEEARNALSRVRFDRLEDGDRRKAYRLLADLARDPVAQVRWLAFYRAELDDEQQIAQTDDTIDAALVGIDGEGLAELSKRLGAAPPIARVWLARAERALDGDDLETASEALEQVQVLPLPPRYAPRLSGAVERLHLRSEGGVVDVAQLPTFSALASLPPPQTAGAEGTLGVVLPLSGPYAHFGEESLHGVLLATGIFGPEEAKPDLEARAPLRVLVRDSAGDPERAAAAVRELAEEQGVTAIVGPLLSAECEAAAGVAEELGVPLLTLTSREEIAHLRRFVFRLRTRPVEETQLLVEKARALGAERFAILYRDDPYGRGLRSLFWQAVEAKGGRVVGVAGYDPKVHDFADPIRRIVGYVLLDSEERRLLEDRKRMLRRARRLPADEARALRKEARALVTEDGGPLPPIVDFDALFIADSFENVVLIAPQLAFHEASGARLLGPDGWYDEDLVRIGREHLEGAIFVAHYFAESEVPFVRDFAEAYRGTFARHSNVFAAQAYDAANLVLVQLARGFESRRAVRDGVLSTHGYPGAAGVLSMGADGNAQKRPFLLGVESGQIIQHD
jgi:ABC-type branched-subunit amino acid transport system substrate-binding protein